MWRRRKNCDVSDLQRVLFNSKDCLSVPALFTGYLRELPVNPSTDSRLQPRKNPINHTLPRQTMFLPTLPKALRRTLYLTLRKTKNAST